MRNRTIELLKKLLAAEFPLTLAMLSQEFSVSERTIRNEIDEIDAYLQELRLPSVTRKRKQGVLLSLSSEEKRNVTEDLVNREDVYLDREERNFDLLLTIAFGQAPVFLYKKEEEYLVSKSTMDEDMRRLRSDLVKYGIEIISNGRMGLTYKGSERSIRTMIFDVINRQVGLLELGEASDSRMMIAKKILYKHLPELLLLESSRIVKERLPHIQDDVYKNQIVLFTCIWVGRLQVNETIAAISWESHEKEDTEVTEYIEAVITKFQLEPPVVERDYFEFMLESLNTRDITNTVEWVNAQLVTIQLIQSVEEQTKIPFSKKGEELFEGLYQHIAALLSRLKSGIQVVNPITDNIMKNYTDIFQAIKHYIPTLEVVFGQKVTDDEVAFLAIHFSTAALNLNHEMDLVYKSVVVCNHGLATGNLLAASLKEKFPEIDVTAVFSSRDIKVISKLDVDLIFSTYDIGKTDKPSLVVDPVITEANRGIIKAFLRQHQQFRRIRVDRKGSTDLFNSILEVIEESGGAVTGPTYRKLEDVFKKNNLEINAREIQPMLRDILTDSNILIKATPESWEAAIELSAQPLLKENIIEKSYIDAMIASVNEFGPYIVIGKHLALAHARPEDGVNKLGVSVVTLANDVAFGNPEMDPVKIIFCLAAVDSYSHLNIMRELVELINDEEKMTELIAAPDVESFKALLYQDTTEA